MQKIGWTAVAIASALVFTGAAWSVSAQGPHAKPGLGAKIPGMILAPPVSRPVESRCTLATLRGAWGIQIQGSRPSGPGGPIESVIGVVHRTYDGKGGFTQTDNVHGSESGTVPDRPGSGTYQVNADCTAVAFLDLPGPPFFIEERLVIVGGGEAILGIVANPGPVMVSSVHQRIHAR